MIFPVSCPLNKSRVQEAGFPGEKNDMTIFQKIWQAFERVNAWIYAAGAMVIFLLGAMTIRDVVGRYLFNYPLQGNLELSELAMVTIIFLCFGYSITLKAHINVNIVTQRLPGKARVVLEIVTNSLTLLFLIIMASQSARIAIEQRGNCTDTLQIPTFFFTLLVPIGATLAAISLIGHIAGNIRSLVQDKGAMK